MNTEHREWARLRQAASRQPLVSADEEPDLIARANAGDAQALARLVDAHRRLVVEVAARHARACIPASDLVGEGLIGLVEAIRRCDPAHGARLGTYARWWIRARVRNYALANRGIVPLPSTRAGRRTLAKLASSERTLIRALGRAPTREELAQHIGVDARDVDAMVGALAAPDVTLDGELELGTQAADPERLAGESERHALLQRALCLLSRRERQVVRAQLDDEDLSFSAVARTLGVSPQRTSQIAARARAHLREAFA